MHRSTALSPFGPLEMSPTRAAAARSPALLSAASASVRERVASGEPGYTSQAMSRAQLEEDLERLHPASFAWSVACCRGNPAEAEEILQTAYLKVLEGRARFGGRSSFKTWLFAVIRRTAQSQRRRGEWRRWLLVRWSREAPAATSAGPQERLEGDQRRARVRAALATLSPRQRQVLELVFYHDLSVREAGEVLGVSIGTARVHYDRGKKELLRQLEEDTDHER